MSDTEKNPEHLDAETPAPETPAPETPAAEAPDVDDADDSTFAVPYWAPERAPAEPVAAEAEAPLGMGSQDMWPGESWSPPPAPVPAVATPSPFKMSREATIVTAVMGVLAVVVAVLLGWVLYSANSDQAAEDSRVDAPVAAAAQVKLMFEFDHGAVRDQMAKALEGTTGDFRAQFEKEINDSVIPNAEANDSSVTATVIGQGAVTATKDTATVLVYVNQVVNANTGPKATFTPSRLLVDMTKVDGNWKVSGLTAV